MLPSYNNCYGGRMLQILVSVVIFELLGTVGQCWAGPAGKFLTPPVIEIQGIKNNKSSSSSSAETSDPVIILISFDGFRHNYLDRLGSSHLRTLANSGVRAKYMQNQFITKTFPNHQSIATGLYVESHGVTDNWGFDPLLNKTVGGEEEEFWNFNENILPLWTLNEESGGNHRSGVMMWPGSNFTYGPRKTKPSHVVDWNESISWEWRVDTVINWLRLEDGSRPNLVFMYFEEPDEFAHAFGPESSEVTNQIQRVDNITGYLVSQLQAHGLFHSTNLIITSDHGFQEVRQDRIINISSAVDKSFYKTYGSTPVLHLLPEAEKFQIVYQSMMDLAKRNGHFRVFSKETLPENWHYGNNRRVMPIVLVADLGYAFDDFYKSIEFFDNKYNLTADPSRVYGVHGYDNKELEMQPFFLAHGPLFQIGAEVQPFENVDLFPLLCLVLGLEAPPNNGTTIGNLNMLKHSQEKVMGFGIHSPVGWVLGAAVLLGLTILFGILSMMIVKRRNQATVVVVDNGYRFVNEGERMEVMDHVVPPTRGHPTKESSRRKENNDGSTMSRGNIFENGSNDEIQALLLSSSNEEL